MLIEAKKPYTHLNDNGTRMTSGCRSRRGPALVPLLPPAELRRDVAQHAVQEVGVVVDTELVRNRQK